MNRAQHQLMQIVQKISVFDGLSLDQAERLMQVARFKKFDMGDTVYDVGKKSDEMLVLIKGKLTVLSATGQSLGEVLPGKSTGEMGLFTGHDRSATIVAAEECAGLSMSRDQLLAIMNFDPVIKSIILENVVTELSIRLAEANTRLDVLSQANEAQAPSTPEEAPLVSSETEGSEEEIPDVSDEDFSEAGEEPE